MARSKSAPETEGVSRHSWDECSPCVRREQSIAEECEGELPEVYEMPKLFVTQVEEPMQLP